VNIYNYGIRFALWIAGRVISNPALGRAVTPQRLKLMKQSLFNGFKAVVAVAAEEGTTNNNNYIITIIKLVRVEYCFLKMKIVLRL
jgi:hypothetical protein